MNILTSNKNCRKLNDWCSKMTNFSYCHRCAKFDNRQMDKIPFGLKDGKIVDITEIDSGRNCNCVCPNCKRPLIAAKGEKNTHHFKHDKNDDDKRCVESILHLAAKDIFKKYSNTVFPEVYLFGKNEYKRHIKFIGKQEIKYAKVEIEEQEQNFVPDVKLITNNDEIYFIEIAVTHKIDYHKYLKLKQRDVSTIEINLSKLYKSLKKNKQVLTLKLLEDFVVNETKNKRWIYHKERNDFYNYMKAHHGQLKETNEIIYKSYAPDELTEALYNAFDILYSEWFYVINCPLKKGQFESGKYKGKTYANVQKHCRTCSYNAGIDFEIKTNSKKRSFYNAPTRVNCIYQNYYKFKDSIAEITKNIKTIHGNKKVKIKQRENTIQKGLFD